MVSWAKWSPFDAGFLVWTGRERCGFVVEGWTFLEVRNISKEPEKFFEMDGDTVREIFNRYTVVGVWHSHPTGCPEPSLMDKEWHHPSTDIYIVCDLAVRRFVSVPGGDWKERPVQWTVSSAASA